MPKKTEKKDNSDKQDASFYTSISRFYDHIFPFSPQQQRFIMKHIQNPETASLLEIGCGTGSLSLELSRRCRFCEGIDLDDTMIRIAQQKLESNRTRQEASEPEASEKNKEAAAKIPRRAGSSHSASHSAPHSASLSSPFSTSHSANHRAEFRVLNMMNIASAFKAESFTLIF
ncbi:MAG: class I SAM-dependent methyltransferase, partial [Spirochaetia bacterium]|nr:class I SAM-dependent methyltransferase [Spirochaetia bacterium]